MRAKDVANAIAGWGLGLFAIAAAFVLGAGLWCSATWRPFEVGGLPLHGATVTALIFPVACFVYLAFVRRRLPSSPMEIEKQARAESVRAEEERLRKEREEAARTAAQEASLDEEYDPNATDGRWHWT